MNNECVIGIDIGGTNIRIGRTDENDKLVDFERVSSKETFKDGNISESLTEVLKNYLDKYCKNVQVKQIAIGIPATLSSDRKQILQVPNIKGMDGLFLGKELEENLGIPVVLEKDVNMLYYWDKYDKKLSDEGVGIGVYIGTGVGNAIFINGKPLAGKDGVAGELGHIPMIGGTSQCGCGNLGCSECYASGWKLVELKEKYYPDVDMNDLFVKKSNDTVLKNFVDNIACVACAEINILNPDSIIFGGGVINMKGFPKDYLEERLYVHARKPYPAESLEIQYSEDKVDNGVKGAIIFAKTLLEKYGYECITTDDFSSVLSAIEAASPHLILLDINLPHFDGYHICREIRSHSQIPIIIVTSRNSDVDELMSMNLGADDFITKPYHTQILLARIAALLKRSYQTDHESQLEHNGVMLSLSDSTITANGQTAELTKNELKILHLLMQNKGTIQSRDELINALWQTDEFIDDNTLTVNINRLRKKLESIGVTNYLKTKRGMGYIV